LPAWFSLQAYGRLGYEDIVTRCINTAVALGEALNESPDYELLAPVKLNVVAFILRGKTEADTDRYVQRLNDQGKYFLSPTTLFGRRGLRAAFVNWQHDPAQVPEIMAALDTALHSLNPAPASTP
jgi:glutamate/tyrosine decarboxylase-like PLP-dependent enzyme